MDLWEGCIVAVMARVGPITTEDYCYRNVRARGPENRTHGPQNLHSINSRARLGRARLIIVGGKQKV